MKISHVLPLLIKGGAERVAVDLANQAALSGHEVTIIAAYPVDSSQLRDSLDSRVRVLYVSAAAVSKVKIYLDILPWLWRNRLWLAQQDILHCHLTYGALFGALVCFFRNLLGAKQARVVETYHSVGMGVPPITRWIHAKLLERFDAVAFMAEDDYWRAFIKRRPHLLSVIIPNGISFQGLINPDSIVMRKYRSEIGIPDECRYIVGTVGRLRPDRKPWFYLPVFAEIAKVFGKDVHFVIAGDGPEYAHISSLAEEYGLKEQVHLPGLVMEPRLAMSIMNLYLTLNVGAITGIAAMEAASLGVPILAIQMLPNYRAQSQDWIWSDTDLSGIAKKAIELLHNQSELRALGLRQSAYVRFHHGVESMARSYEAFYQEVLGKKTANVDTRVVRDFGSEWSRFNQSNLSASDQQEMFESYFSVFPWSKLLPNAVGVDIGCGSGRWASLVAPRVGHLHLIDPSKDTLAVARKNLSNLTNVSFYQVSASELPFKDESLDFAYSLGVLHHVPDTRQAIACIANVLKPGAPFLVYLYYALDNRPWWFRVIWGISDVFRKIISKLPVFFKNFICEIIAFLVYLPLARLALLLEWLKVLPHSWPLAYYRRSKFYVMRTDALDRFGTRLEKRFSRKEIMAMLEGAGFMDIQFSNKPPFWCAVGIKKAGRVNLCVE